MTNTPTGRPTTVRLDPDVREGAQRVADAERRSLNNTINVLIREALAARGTGGTELHLRGAQ